MTIDEFSISIRVQEYTKVDTIMMKFTKNKTLSLNVVTGSLSTTVKQQNPTCFNILIVKTPS